MKALFLIILALFSESVAFSQMLPVTSQIFDQKFTLIPSLAGINDYNTITLSSQKQWIGMNHSPYTFIMGLNSKIGNFDFYNPTGLLNKTGLKTKDRSGVGFQIFSDQAGFIRNSGVNLTYAYHYPIGKNRLSIGLSLKATQDFFQNDKLLPYQKNDPLVPEFNETNYFFNSNIGLSYYQAYNFYAGLAVHNSFNSTNKIQKNIQISVCKPANAS